MLLLDLCHTIAYYTFTLQINIILYWRYNMKVLRKREVLDRVGYSAGHLWLLEREGKFPQRIELQPGGAVGWLEHEIDDWIEARVAARNHDPRDNLTART